MVGIVNRNFEDIRSRHAFITLATVRNRVRTNQRKNFFDPLMVFHTIIISK